MALMSGDQLSVSDTPVVDLQSEIIFGRPRVEARRYNRSFNSIYDYSDSYLKGSTIKSVNSLDVVCDELVIVNLKDYEEPIDFQVGFSIIEESQPLSAFWESELSGVPSDTQGIIKAQNKHLNDPLVPGEMVIFLTREPSSKDEKAKLKILIDNANVASAELGNLTTAQIELHQTYFEVIENKLVEYWNSGTPSDTFAYMGAVVGTIAPAMQKNLENVSASLKKMDRLYLALLSKKIDRASFVRQRQGLKKILDSQLDKLMQRTLRIPVDQGLKRSLGITSTKSLIHNADEILKTGSVPELGGRVANTAKWVRYAENAGKVSLGLGVASALYNVSTECTDLNSCTKQVTVESGGVIGGWAGVWLVLQLQEQL